MSRETEIGICPSNRRDAQSHCLINQHKAPQRTPTFQPSKMKLSSILAVTLAVVAPAAVDAANCKTGLHYCGYVLLRRGIVFPILYELGIPRSCADSVAGDYYNQIIGALKKADKSTSSSYVNHSLFYCTGGTNGNIKYQAKCSSCVDGGDGKSDHC
ncbi:hypothetical protein QBC41DRAFT_322121 [Cercophora samala]|uniref:Uncharacterized protein n=1 Tax=Cercophora samala TaxID=330535 RepID=A0AA40DC74_9PEZI|nr:hypothetical protein QBC41DRAFT_322121 [Cercophora samala]